MDTLNNQPNILLAMPDYSEAIHRGIADYGRRKDWHIHVARLGHSCPHFWRGSGIISSHYPDSVLGKFVDSLHVPKVGLGLVTHSITPTVKPNRAAASALAAEHLIAQGHSRLVFMRLFRSWYHAEYEAGFAEVCKRHQLPFKSIALHEERTNKEPNHPLLMRLLAEMTFPTGVFAAHDLLAEECIYAAMEVGIRIPEDIALIGSENIELTCDYAPVTITSIDLDHYEIGRKAAQIIDRMISGAQVNTDDCAVPSGRLLPRKSSDALAFEHLGLRLAVEYIRKNYHLPLTVSDIGQKAGMNPRTLQRAIKQALNCTINEFLAATRLKTAKQLLEQTDVKVKIIAERTGFSNDIYFYQFFKKETGMTPGEFRLAITETADDNNARI